MMKRLILLALATLSLGTHAQAPVTDTIVGRCSRFYYDAWYDECPSFQTHDYSFATGYLRGCDLYAPCTRMTVQEFYTPEPLTLYGLAAMVVDPRTLDRYSESGWLPDSITERLPEQLALFQAGAPNPLSSYYFPPALTLIDTVRWDTAAPKLLMLPLNMYAVAGDSTDYATCLLYEVRFPEPVTVDSFFYIGGTFFSSGRADESFEHLPTVYQFLYEDPNIDRCLFCQPHRRILNNNNYDGYGRFLGDWIIQNDKYLMGHTSGPFLPVVAP